MSLFACTPLLPMSLFVTNFEYSHPPYPGDVIFEWHLKELTNITFYCKVFFTNILMDFSNGFRIVAL